jgi:acetyltransferase-like isoleucine patch superfamily enzyme
MNVVLSKPIWKRVGKRVLHSGIPIPRVCRPVIRGLYKIGVLIVELWAFVKKLLWIEPVVRSVCEHVGTGLRAECLPYMRGQGRLSLGDNVNLSGRSCFYFLSYMPETPESQIGSGVFIGNGCTLASARRIEIGDHCLLAPFVRIHDNDGHPTDAGKRREGRPIGPDDVAEVVIEDNVWLGASCTVLKGVRVGANSIVGTGAVVTSDVPPNSIVAGNPARVIREGSASTDAS